MNVHTTKDGRKFTIRTPVVGDAAEIISYSKILFASTDQILTTLEEYTVTVENEEAWINAFNDDPDSIILVADMNGQILGLLFFVVSPKKKSSHTGEFGVSVHPDFQGMGIGRQMIGTLLKWAKVNENIEKVFLQVFDTNKHAIRLYKSMGFKEEGRHIKVIKQSSGEYVDVLQMYTETK